MKKVLVFAFVIATTATQAIATEVRQTGEKGQLKAIISNLLQDNAKFMSAHDAKYFAPFASEQHPRATVIMCSDSRVHTHALDQTPDGDLFMVRNIGNQLATAEGSVEYGVHHLHTPLLVVLGHSGCGAVKAASGNYAAKSPTIKRELDGIKIAKGVDNMAGVRHNVHNQVAAAVTKFEKEVRAGTLVVVGAIYDFRNDLKQGQGKLIIVNLNGETDEAKIRQSDVLKAFVK